PASLGGGDAPGGRRRPLLGAGWLILGTSLLKLYFVSLFPWIPDGSDADAYVSVARYLATGGSILRDDPAGGLISVTSPLYTMVLALTSGLTVLTRGNVLGWKLLQVAAAALLIPLLADLAGRLFGPRSAWVAALLAGFSPLWFLSAELLQYELW